MPLDSTDFVIETKPDLSKPSLEGLSWLLRHMPSDHNWDFAVIGGRKWNGCGSDGCAIGLGVAVWGMRKFFQVYEDFAPKQVLERLFLEGLSSYGVLHNHVTPTMVADRIDEFLRSRK